MYSRLLYNLFLMLSGIISYLIALRLEVWLQRHYHYIVLFSVQFFDAVILNSPSLKQHQRNHKWTLYILMKG